MQRLVKVRFFAAAQEVAGKTECEAKVSDEVTVAQAALAAGATDGGAQTELEAVLRISSFLVGSRWVEGNRILADFPEEDIIDVLPPFAGG